MRTLADKSQLGGTPDLEIHIKARCPAALCSCASTCLFCASGHPSAWPSGVITGPGDP